MTAVTIRDVAQLARVSIATVSHTISGHRPVSPETAARVLAAVDELGYRPNRIAVSMVTRATKTLGLIVPDIANPFFARLVKAVERAAIERGYTTIACSSEQNAEIEARYLDLLLENQVDALLYDGDHRRVASYLERLAARGTAVVVIDRVDGRSSGPFASVTVNNAAGGALVAHHLLELGHRRIGVVAGRRTLSTSIDRLKGFRRVLSENGVPITRENICYAGDLTLEAGIPAVEQLLTARPTITALFCENDLIALAAIRVVHQMGLQVPGDISIAGFDDIFVSSLVSPTLTTVRQPVDDLGAVAVDTAVRLFEKQAPSTRLVLPVELMCRESSATVKSS